MKHFFCISSHLAFSICNHLIQIDGLAVDDCIFLTTRGYRLPANGVQYHVVETDFNSSAQSGRLFAGWHIVQTIRNIRLFDEIIDTHTDGDDYFFYTQICNNDISSVCVTNPHCKGYYIIEDGVGSYRHDDLPTFRGLRYFIYRCFLKPVFPRIYMLKSRMIEVNHPKFKGCIATNTLCFPTHQDSLRVIGLPFHPEPLPNPPQALLSLDPYYLWLTDEQVEIVFKQLGVFINKYRYKSLMYKPHPYLLVKENQGRYILYKQYLQRYISAPLEELEAQICLENTLMAHRDCSFYTAVSSVAIYAKAMGVKCYTFAPLLRQFCSLSVPVVEDMCIPIKPE